MHRFKIPLKPVSLNQAYMVGRGAGFKLSKQGRKFKEDCQDFLKEQFLEDKPFDKKLKVTIFFQLRDFREVIDVDNMFKLLIDSMKGIVFKDDSQIYKLSGEKEIGMNRNEIHIVVEDYKKKELENGNVECDESFE